MSKSITLEWRGTEYFIGESDAFAVGEQVEEVVSLTELANMGHRPKFFKLARAYGVMLRFAGAPNVKDAEIHSEMMAAIKGGQTEKVQELIAGAVAPLLHILMDGAPTDGGDGKPGEAAAS